MFGFGKKPEGIGEPGTTGEILVAPKKPEMGMVSAPKKETSIAKPERSVTPPKSTSAAIPNFEQVSQKDDPVEREIKLRSERVLMKEAEKILGPNLIGPSDLEKIFGTKLNKQDVPLIPFTKEELKEIGKSGNFLIFHAGQDAQGELLSFQNLIKKIDIKSTKRKLSEAFPEDDSENDVVPETGWRLVRVADQAPTRSVMTLGVTPGKTNIANYLTPYYFEIGRAKSLVSATKALQGVLLNQNEFDRKVMAAYDALLILNLIRTGAVLF